MVSWTETSQTFPLSNVYQFLNGKSTEEFYVLQKGRSTEVWNDRSGPWACIKSLDRGDGNKLGETSDSKCLSFCIGWAIWQKHRSITLPGPTLWEAVQQRRELEQAGWIKKTASSLTSVAFISFPLFWTLYPFNDPCFLGLALTHESVSFLLLLSLLPFMRAI